MSQIHTCVGGYNSGRIYKLKMASVACAEEWCTYLRNESKKAAARHFDRSFYLKLQIHGRSFINNDIVQVVIAVCIFANFVANAAQV